MSEQLNIHGGAEPLRVADPPAPATHEAPPLFEFPSGLRGQMDLNAWCESVTLPPCPWCGRPADQERLEDDGASYMTIVECWECANADG